MNYFSIALVWFKLGWPLAKVVFEVMKDGKITKAEAIEAVSVAMGDREEIVIWKNKAS